MVQGMSTIQNANEKRTAAGITSRIRAETKRLDLATAESTSVPPTAAAKSPLSGRNSTARPPINPAAAHHASAFLRVVALKAKVAASTIATARKLAHASVRIVAT